MSLSLHEVLTVVIWRKYFSNAVLLKEIEGGTIYLASYYNCFDLKKNTVLKKQSNCKIELNVHCVSK